jgi:phospholipid transport system substrate-binding protein
MRKILLMTALVFTFGLVAGGAAAADSPMAVLKKANKKITKLLDEKIEAGSAAAKLRDDKIKKIVDGFLDFETLSTKAMGKHWEERTEEEKGEYSKLFRELIQKNYLKQIHEKADYEMLYDSEQIDVDKAVVNTTVKAKNKQGEEAETAVVYKLRKAKGKWLVVDIETDEVSLVGNYRSQFNKIITKDGFKALIEKMKKKIDEGTSDTKL